MEIDHSNIYQKFENILSKFKLKLNNKNYFIQAYSKEEDSIHQEISNCAKEWKFLVEKDVLLNTIISFPGKNPTWTILGGSEVEAFLAGFFCLLYLKTNKIVPNNSVQLIFFRGGQDNFFNLEQCLGAQGMLGLLKEASYFCKLHSCSFSNYATNFNNFISNNISNNDCLAKILINRLIQENDPTKILGNSLQRVLERKPTIKLGSIQNFIGIRRNNKVATSVSNSNCNSQITIHDSSIGRFRYWIQIKKSTDPWTIGNNNNKNNNILASLINIYQNINEFVEKNYSTQVKINIGKIHTPEDKESYNNEAQSIEFSLQFEALVEYILNDSKNYLINTLLPSIEDKFGITSQIISVSEYLPINFNEKELFRLIGSINRINQMRGGKTSNNSIKFSSMNSYQIHEAYFWEQRGIASSLITIGTNLEDIKNTAEILVKTLT